VLTQDSRGTRYELTGSGPAVVLVHGLGLNHAMWQWTAPQIAARYRVLSYDLLGHGASARPIGPYALQQFVDQLAALVEHVGLERFALIGFSLGGLISQAFTLAHPGRVRGLVVLHSAYDRSAAERAAIMQRVHLAETAGPVATVDQALERWFTAAFAAQRPDVLAQVRAWVLANDRQAFAAAYHVLAQADAELAERIGDIACPALVITGSEDFGNSPDMARRCARRMRQAECSILPGLRHMALAERPEAVLALLLPFLDKTAGL